MMAIILSDWVYCYWNPPSAFSFWQMILSDWCLGVSFSYRKPSLLWEFYLYTVRQSYLVVLLCTVGNFFGVLLHCVKFLPGLFINCGGDFVLYSVPSHIGVYATVLGRICSLHYWAFPPVFGRFGFGQLVCCVIFFLLSTVGILR